MDSISVLHSYFSRWFSFSRCNYHSYELYLSNVSQLLLELDVMIDPLLTSDHT